MDVPISLKESRFLLRRLLSSALLASLFSIPVSAASAAMPIPPPPPLPTAVPAPPAPPSQLHGVAATLLAAINKDRAKHKAAPLILDSKQSACSMKHSLHMAAAGYLAHDQFPADICIPHELAAENIGEARGDPTQAALMLHRIMMSEGPCPHKGCSGTELGAHGHYLNLINPRYTRVGLGLVEKNGTLWLTENFTG
jgi:uncharacterized protein YkwD